MQADITTLLSSARAGEHDAVQRLTDAVYSHLHQIAGSQMRKERAGHTLQPTALVNEAYLRLFQNQQVDWQNREHFFAIAASQMRRILIEHGRRRNAGKRHGIHVELKDAGEAAAAQPHTFGDVEALLEKLQATDAAAARIVELKVFAGFTDDEVARIAGVTRGKVRADWGFAKAWLASRLGAGAKT